jgi:PBP1b-binding outer membrane lipoprotein LpoB
MKKILVFVLFAVLIVVLVGCVPGSNANLDSQSNAEIQFTTPGTNPELDTPAENGHIAGLGTGLWHGLISVVTLIVSFFNPAVQMYEVHNNGPMYNLGFLLGAIMLFAILGFSGGRRRR